MGLMESLSGAGIRLELARDNNIRAIGQLTDDVRKAIKAQKQSLVAELQWREFEILLAIVGPAYKTPEHEFAEIRNAARADLAGALIAYREMVEQIGPGEKCPTSAMWTNSSAPRTLPSGHLKQSTCTSPNCRSPND